MHSRAEPTGTPHVPPSAEGRRRTPRGRSVISATLRAVIACAALALAGCGGVGGMHVRSDPVPRLLPVAETRSCPGGAWALGAPIPSARRAHPASSASALAGGVLPCPYAGVRLLGSAAAGVLRQPEAIAVGPGGRVYVGDQFTHEIEVFTTAGAFVEAWGGAGSAPGRFGAVGGLAVDAAGDIYLADCGNDRIEVFTPKGRLLREWGRYGSGLGELDLGAGNGPSEPPGGGIALSRSYVYVADTRNDRIERFDLDGSHPLTIATRGRAPGEVMHPKGLAVGPPLAAPGHARVPEALYVADNGNVRVEELGLDGGFIAEAPHVFPATPPSFQNPYDVAVDGRSVYVVDDNHGRIVRFSRDLRFEGAFGGTGDLALTPFPRAVATGPNGTVYVADAHGNDVVAFDSAGRPLLRFGISANDPGEFVDPVDVALGPAGENLVVESFAGLIHLRGLTALRQREAWTSGGEVFLGNLWYSPAAADFAPDGTVWVTDRNNRVVRHITYAGRFLGAAGDPTGAGAPPSHSVPGYAAPSEPTATGGPVRFLALAEPSAVAVEEGGAVLVADAGSGTIYTLSPQGSVLSAWRSAAGGGEEVRFRSPRALAIGPDGSIYIADTGNDRVERLSRSGRLLASWGGAGTGAGRFEQPAGIAVDAVGDVFVSDATLQRIQEFDSSGRLIAVWGIEGAQHGALDAPLGLALDCSGDLFVADSENNRVVLFTGVAPPAASPFCAGRR